MIETMSDIIENTALKFEKAAYILKTVAHPIRLAIIQMLEDGKALSVSEICETLKGEQSLISHHLINMKLRGILQSTKDGQSVYYSLKEKDVSKLIHCIEHCGCNM